MRLLSTLFLIVGLPLQSGASLPPAGGHLNHPAYAAKLQLHKRTLLLSKNGTSELRSPFKYLYTTRIKIDGQEFTVEVDTGSPVLAVAAAPSFPHGPGGGTFYNGSCSGPDSSFAYGSGNWSGTVCGGATIELAGLSAGKPLFAGIKDIQMKTDPGPFAMNLTGPSTQGILGLAYAKQAQYVDSKVSLQFALLIDGCSSCSASAQCQQLCDRDHGSKNSHLFKPLLDSLVDQGTGLKRIFSMQCCGTFGPNQRGRGDAVSSPSGTLVIGGIDDTLFTGTLQYTPVIFEGMYSVNVTSVGTSVSAMVAFDTPPPAPKGYGPPYPLLTKDVLTYYEYQQATFYVDSGSPFLGLGRGEAFAKVQTAVNYAAAAAGLGPVITTDGTLPACVTRSQLRSFPDVVLELAGGVALSVPPSGYLQPQLGQDCLWPVISNLLHVLGAPVLETYYTVYDQELARLGFAPVANCGAS